MTKLHENLLTILKGYEECKKSAEKAKIKIWASNAHHFVCASNRNQSARNGRHRTENFLKFRLSLKFGSLICECKCFLSIKMYSYNHHRHFQYFFWHFLLHRRDQWELFMLLELLTRIKWNVLINEHQLLHYYKHILIKNEASLHHVWKLLTTEVLMRF